MIPKKFNFLTLLFTIKEQKIKVMVAFLVVSTIFAFFSVFVGIQILDTMAILLAYFSLCAIFTFILLFFADWSLRSKHQARISLYLDYFDSMLESFATHYQNVSPLIPSRFCKTVKLNEVSKQFIIDTTKTQVYQVEDFAIPATAKGIVAIVGKLAIGKTIFIYEVMSQFRREQKASLNKSTNRIKRFFKIDYVPKKWRHLPFFVDLSFLPSIKKAENRISFHEQLSSLCSVSLNVKNPDTSFTKFRENVTQVKLISEEILKRGESCYYFFDGLDELNDNRSHNFMRDVKKYYKGQPVIVSGRDFHQEKSITTHELLFKDIKQVVQLQELTEKQADGVIVKPVGVQIPANTASLKKKLEEIKSADKHPHLLNFRNPFLLQAAKMHPRRVSLNSPYSRVLTLQVIKTFAQYLNSISHEFSGFRKFAKPVKLQNIMANQRVKPHTLRELLFQVHTQLTTQLLKQRFITNDCIKSTIDDCIHLQTEKNQTEKNRAEAYREFLVKYLLEDYSKGFIQPLLVNQSSNQDKQHFTIHPPRVRDFFILMRIRELIKNQDFKKLQATMNTIIQQSLVSENFSDLMQNEYHLANAEIQLFNFANGTTVQASDFKTLIDLDIWHSQTKFKIEQKRIIKLDLSNLWLFTLQASVTTLSELQELNLSSNRLSSLPESLGKLNKLKVLILDENRFKELPSSISEMLQLTRLSCKANRLRSFPKWIEQLKNLRELELGDNKLYSLSEKPLQLPNLKLLGLSKNKLSSFPESILLLRNLENLQISDNELIALPEDIGRLKKLQSLNLSGNTLTSLPENITELNELRVLNLGFNQVKILPKSLANLIKLVTLNLVGNSLKLFPKCITMLRCLEVLNLALNQLKSLPENINELSNLREIILWGNEISELPKSIVNLSKLRRTRLR